MGTKGQHEWGSAVNSLPHMRGSAAAGICATCKGQNSIRCRGATSAGSEANMQHPCFSKDLCSQRW